MRPRPPGAQGAPHPPMRRSAAYRLAPAAQADLEAIYFWYLEQADALTADTVSETLFTAFDRITKGLAAALRRPDWLPDPYRLTLSDPYWVVWRPDGKSSILVLRILHARRDVRRLLLALRGGK